MNDDEDDESGEVIIVLYPILITSTFGWIYCLHITLNWPVICCPVTIRPFPLSSAGRRRRVSRRGLAVGTNVLAPSLEKKYDVPGETSTVFFPFFGLPSLLMCSAWFDTFFCGYCTEQNKNLFNPSRFFPADRLCSRPPYLLDPWSISRVLAASERNHTRRLLVIIFV